MKITIEYRPSFGRGRYYPACINSKKIVEDLMNNSCLTQRNLNLLKELGFEVEIILPEMEY